MTEEARISILWMADDCAEIRCVCGHELIIDHEGQTCSDCGRRFRLIQRVEELPAEEPER